MLKFGVNIFLGTAIAMLLLAGGSLLWLRQVGSRALSVQSGSMAPAIQKGDLVIVKSVPQYQVGDVITFISPQDKNTTITHRIISTDKKRGILQTKGDANQRADRNISKAMVVGRVNQTIPTLGHAMDFVRKPLGLLLIIYVPALMIVFQELRLLIQHYRRMQPYLIPGRHQRVRSSRMPLGVKLGALCFVTIAMTIAIPARAALFSKVTLSGNTITAVSQRLADNILLRRVEFECSLDNTDQVNKLPGIIMHNPTAQDKSTGNWYIESSEGRLVTFRPQTVFDSHDDYDIEPDLLAGVHYEGDFLALFDNTGTLVDAISWGTDTTYLNPTLPGTQERTVFRRIDLVFDTNTAVDWSVSVAPCDPDHL